MNRLSILVGAALGASSLLLIDSAIKGAAVLLIATVVVLLLRRDSAATRHFVWLVAIVGLLVVPVFSAVLPQWRVLPAWATISTLPPVADVVSVETAMTSVSARTAPSSHMELPPVAVVLEALPPEGVFVADEPILQAPGVARPPVVAVTIVPPSGDPRWSMLDVIPLVWALGFAVLLIRLSAARLMLWSSECRGTVVAIAQTTISDSPTESSGDRIVDAFRAACRQLGVRRRVRLLIHSERTIPVVWGIIRIRLLLPESARTWSDEQLQSVLLHELGHIKRGDAMTQLLAQLACALHWFNPAVWFASWRMHVERERACDDLVLASGVKPSAYAEHLLDVATRLSPAKWTQACGLAMARKSSLEGRLRAVLNKRRNRRSVSATLGTVTLVAGVGIAIPIAMLRATDGVLADEGAVVGGVEETRDSEVDDDTVEDAGRHDAMPSDTTAAVLLKRWQALEERKSPISEASVARLRAAIDKWVKQPPAKADAAQVLALRDRHIDRAEHPTFEVAGWLSAIAAINRGPLQFAINGETRIGEALSEERQATLKFGPVAENGLRAAWSRYPQRDTYVVGDVVTSAVVIQNASDKTVEFTCPYSVDSLVKWDVTAQDGRKIPAKTSSLRGSTPIFTWRLKPGEATSIGGRSVAIGVGARREKFDNFHITTVLDAKAGEDVTVRWDVREPVEMVTGDVSFKIVAPEDVPVWSTRRAGDWQLAGGVTMEVKQRLVHASDVSSTAVLTWPQNKDGGTARHIIWLAGDAFANREPWMLAWERDATVLWTLKGEMQSSRDFPSVSATPAVIRRIDFSDPERITETTWRGLPEVLPESIRAKLTEGFLPMKAEPTGLARRQPGHRIFRAEDVRPVADLLSGKWIAQLGDVKLSVTFAAGTNSVQWVAPNPQAPGAEPIVETLTRLQSAGEDSVRLIRDGNSPAGRKAKLVARLQRGIGDTLLLRVFDRAEFSKDVDTSGIVLHRALAIADNVRSAAAPAEKEPVTKEEVARKPGKKDRMRIYADLFTKSAGHHRQKDGSYPSTAFKYLRKHVAEALKKSPNRRYATEARTWMEATAVKQNWSADQFVELVLEIAKWDFESFHNARRDEEFGARYFPKPGHVANPENLKGLSFGPAAENGLRVAWGFDPSRKECPVGEIVNSRVMIHNSGERAAQFIGPGKQGGRPSIRDQQLEQDSAPHIVHADLRITPSSWSFQRYRLEPGQFVEFSGRHVGIGISGVAASPVASKMRIAIWPIEEAQEGDTVMFSVESVLGGEGSQAIKPSDGTTRLAADAISFYAKDEFPEEQARDWSGVLQSGVVKINVVAADDPTAATVEPASSKDEPTDVAAAEPVVELKPEDRVAQTLFKIWQANARTDGKIPGGLIGRLGEMVEYFNQLNKDEVKELVAKFEALLPWFDATVDWSQADAVALLDDVAAVHRIPLLNTLNIAEQRVIRTGEPLPPELVDAPWGAPADNGLRVAWHLSPRAKEYRLGTSLKSRILVHNSGEETVIFSMPSWQQSSTHTAHDDGNKAIKVSSTNWTTMASMKIVKLAPGAYYETPAPGIGVGPRTEDEDWAHIRPGAWIEAKKGDDVRFTPGLIEVRFSPRAFGTSTVDGRPTNTHPKDAVEFWDRIVTERLDREMPLPAGAADRAQLLRRVVHDLYDVEPAQGEIDAYVADKSPGALHPIAGRDLLKTRVQQGRKLSPFTGTLPSGDISFRVLAADPDAANSPRVATGPGFYNLGDRPRLVISQTRNGNRLINSATMHFHMRYYYSEKNKAAPGPHAISLPEGRLTYAIVWDRNATELWVVQKGMVRHCDFGDPASVKETRFYEKESFDEVPKRILDAARKSMPVPDSLKPENVPKPLDGGAKLDPGKEALLQWGEPVNGLRAALIRPPALGGPESPMILDFQLVIQNVSDIPIHFVANTLAPNPRSVTVRSRRFGYTQMRLRTEDSSSTDVLLQPGGITLLDMTRKGRITGASISRNLDTLFTADMTIEKAPPGAWTGRLVSAEMHAAFAAHGLLPKHKDAREVFKLWNQGARLNRTIPGGLIGLLADSVTVFTKSNPTWKTTPQLLQVLPRLDASRDWEPHDVVALLDEVAAIQASPVSALLENERATVMRRGKPLPKDLTHAPWGKTQANGLRLAWLLEPQKPEVEIGTALKSRVLVYNSGDDIVVFRTRNWHQTNDHKARDARGADINVSSMRSTMRTQVVPFRLNPGDYLELPAAAIGVGPRGDGDAWKGTRVGSWIEAKIGDDVTFQPASIGLLDDRPRSKSAGKVNWWHDLVTARLRREMPVPMDDEVRKRLVYHVGLDLGTSNSSEIVNAFLADRQPNALETLAKRLVEQSRPVAFTGSLESGPTKFRLVDARAASVKKRVGGPVDDARDAKPASATRPVPAATEAATSRPAAAARPKRSDNGPIRSANHSGNFRLENGRRLTICRPTVVKPWFTVTWDQSKAWPASRLRIYPKVSIENRRNWAMVWEADSNNLWYIDDEAITHVFISNPAEVLTTRQEFAKPAVLNLKFPEPVRQEFKRLGFDIARGKQSTDNHVTDGQAMLTGESAKQWTVSGTVTGADGKPMSGVPIRLRTQYHPTVDVVTGTTDDKGNYRLSFRLDLRTLARFRGVCVEPVLAGFTERDAEETGLFDALLHSGEKPQRAIVRDYPPMWITGGFAGENEVRPIDRFSKRDLILDRPARADFVMLPASTIMGFIVDSDGNPLPSHYVSVSAPDTVRPRGYEMVASARSDETGRFTLKDIPANELLNFTTSPAGKKWDFSKSASQFFGVAATYRVRVVTGPQGSGSVLKVDR